MRPLALLLLLLLPTQALAGLEIEESILVACAAADIATTEVQLGRGMAEGNPVVQERGPRLLVKAAATTGVILAHRELKKRGKKREAKILIIGVAVLWGFVAARNASLRP